MSETEPRVSPELRRSLLVTCAAVAATQMTWSVVVPALPAFAQSFDVSATEIGLVVSVFGLGRLVINIPAGALAERVDRVRLLRASMVVVVVASFLSGLAPNYEVLLALRLVTGLGGGVAITTGIALITHLAPSGRRGRTISYLQAFQLFGGSAGPAIGGIAAAAWGLGAPFLVSGVAATMVLVASLWMLQVEGPAEARVDVEAETGARTEAGTEAGELERRRGSSWGLLAGTDYLAVCLVGFAIFFMRFGGMHSLVPLIAYHLAGMSVRDLGLVLGAITIGNLGAVLFAGRLSDALGRKPVIVTGLLGSAAGTALYLLVDGPAGFVAATVVMGLSNGIGGPLPMAYLADVVPEEVRGRAIGIYRTFGDGAGVIGPLCMGLLLDVSGYPAAITALALLTAIPGVLFWAAARETVGRKQGHPTWVRGGWPAVALLGALLAVGAAVVAAVAVGGHGI